MSDWFSYLEYQLEYRALFALDLITDCMGIHLHVSQLEFASSQSRRGQHRSPTLDIVFRGGGASDYAFRPIFQRPLLAKNHCPLAGLRFCTALTVLFREATDRFLREPEHSL